MELFLLCMKIFIARIMDVSMGSLRIVYLGKGKSKLAFLFGFIEVFIWFLVAKDALSSDNWSWWIVIAYSLGYAVGTYVGSIISELYVKGNFGVQVVTTDQSQHLLDGIREAGFAVSVIDIVGQDLTTKKFMLFIETKKNRFDQLQKLIKSLDDKAFIVVNETKYVQNGFIK